MKYGKVSEAVLKRSILKLIGHRRKEVLLPAKNGEDATAIELEKDEAVILTVDPITVTDQNMGTYGMHTVLNDLLATGAEPVGVLVSILLPENAREIVIKRIMGELEAVCKTYELEIMGGHTEVCKAVNQPVITLTGVGKTKKQEVITTKGLSDGDELVMTKWAGLEGTAILAKNMSERLTERYTKAYIEGAETFIEQLSVWKEATLAKNIGCTCMHDLTEGGVYGALWEMAGASEIGFEVDLSEIPLRQETVEICEFFDLNPYQLLSGGSLLIGTKQGNKLVEALAEQGIPAAVIGRAVKGNDKVIIRDGERFYLEPTKSDEIYKVI